MRPAELQNEPRLLFFTGGQRNAPLDHPRRHAIAIGSDNLQIAANGLRSGRESYRDGTAIAELVMAVEANADAVDRRRRRRATLGQDNLAVRQTNREKHERRNRPMHSAKT